MIVGSQMPAPPDIRLQTQAVNDAQNPEQNEKLREAFDSFVGNTFFSQMISTMRKSAGKPAYFHGGRAEEVFQGQLDQMLAEHMTEASADQFTGPMFDLFTMRRE